MLLWQGLLNQFHLTKLDGSAAWMCSRSTSAASSSRRPLGIVPSSARQPLGRFVSHPHVGVLSAPSQALGHLTDRCVVVVLPSSSRRGRFLRFAVDSQSLHLHRPRHTHAHTHTHTHTHWKYGAQKHITAQCIG